MITQVSALNCSVPGLVSDFQQLLQRVAQLQEAQDRVAQQVAQLQQQQTAQLATPAAYNMARDEDSDSTAASASAQESVEPDWSLPNISLG